VAEEIKSIAVVSVSSRLRDHAHGTRRRQLCREVERGLAHLKFADRACGNVLRSRADGLVADVDAIHFNSSSAAKSAAERDRRKPVLGRVEIPAVLNLYAGFQLGEIQEVTAAGWKVFDVLAGQ